MIRKEIDWTNLRKVVEEVKETEVTSSPVFLQGSPRGKVESELYYFNLQLKNHVLICEFLVYKDVPHHVQVTLTDDGNRAKRYVLSSPRQNENFRRELNSLVRSKYSNFFKLFLESKEV